ncbi:hypothetical protein OS493_024342 [Desmophyllum pertusum]|uniref:Peptidase M15C domain-containing protein n=1 Tax=Desmophyllum pertusum TaxID=174260 RepID=A0A9W9YLP1_9CNID|nr:hypothetical protein OS493_024342 [Desmophyllum pertusum]
MNGKWLMLLPLVTCITAARVGDSGKCDVVPFKGENFVNFAHVHTGFESNIARISGYATKCGVKVLVTSSFRKYGKPISGPTVVPPAIDSNHLVGHAIDMNLYEGGVLCNSKCLVHPPAQLKGVRCFISSIQRDSTLRWGGDFHTKDPVHIDDGLNVHNRSLYNIIFISLQKNCK